MPKEMITYLTYLKKTLSGFEILIAHPILTIPLFGLMTMGNETIAILVLMIFTFLDYATGVLASWMKAKREKTNEKWFTSERSRLSIVKAISYGLLIVLTYLLEKTFLLKKVHFESWTDTEYSFTLLATGICIITEFYSIVWENLPKAGVDIPGKIGQLLTKLKNIIDGAKSIFK